MPTSGPKPLPLRLLAGRDMAALLLRDGWSADHFDLLLGASGGPKWLVLYGLDLALAPLLAARTRPLPMLGASIGAWRQACYAQADPLAAFERFRAAYLEPPEEAPAGDFSALFARYLERVLGGSGAAEVVANERFVQHIVTARRVHSRGTLVRAYAGPVVRNLVTRRWLGSSQLQRTVFSAAPAQLDSLVASGWSVARRVPLTTDNLAPALLATAAVPGLLQPVAVPGDDGVHVDGGIFDYHFHPGELPAGLRILYPHFYAHLTPGWFDQFVRRRVPARALANTLLVTPSAEFVASLPYAKIPDRGDGRRLSEAALGAYWSTVFERSVELGERFAELVVSGTFARHLEIVS